MGMILAIKRSYRHFLPQPFYEPRKFVRRWFAILSFYAVGLYTGMYIHPVDPSRISHAFLITMVLLIAVKWWARASSCPPEVP